MKFPKKIKKLLKNHKFITGNTQWTIHESTDEILDKMPLDDKVILAKKGLDYFLQHSFHHD